MYFLKPIYIGTGNDHANYRDLGYPKNMLTKHIPCIQVKVVQFPFGVHETLFMWHFQRLCVYLTLRRSPFFYIFCYDTTENSSIIFFPGMNGITILSFLLNPFLFHFCLFNAVFISLTHNVIVSIVVNVSDAIYALLHFLISPFERLE